MSEVYYVTLVIRKMLVDGEAVREGRRAKQNCALSDIDPDILKHVAAEMAKELLLGFKEKP